LKDRRRRPSTPWFFWLLSVPDARLDWLARKIRRSLDEPVIHAGQSSAITKRQHATTTNWANNNRLSFPVACCPLSPMTSIVELFPKCRKLAYDARQQLALTAAATTHGNHSSSVSELHLVLEELNRQLDSMDDLVGRETPAQRTVWKRKIAELRQESATLSAAATATAASSCRSRAGRSGGGTTTTSTLYQTEREELLHRRRKRLDDEGELQSLAAESQSLATSQNMVLDILSSGSASLQELQQQRQRLRGVTRVVADIGSALGLSQATMRIIERRDITDAYFVAAGMVVTLIVLYLTWF
jgi:golgi SNAP receptor complex member 2